MWRDSGLLKRYLSDSHPVISGIPIPVAPLNILPVMKDASDRSSSGLSMNFKKLMTSPMRGLFLMLTVYSDSTLRFMDNSVLTTVFASSRVLTRTAMSFSRKTPRSMIEPTRFCSFSSIVPPASLPVNTSCMSSSSWSTAVFSIDT